MTVGQITCSLTIQVVAKIVTDVRRIFTLYQSVTYRYREFLVPVVFHFFGSTGIRKIWYQKKVSEPASEKFGTRKSLGTGIGKIWYRKNVSELVSEKFGTRKKFRNLYLGVGDK